MKKIVALVLSLVMVLGLATTAFAAPTAPYFTANGLTAGTLAPAANMDLDNYNYSLEPYTPGNAVAKTFDTVVIWMTHKVTGAKTLYNDTVYAVAASADSATSAFVNGSSITYLAPAVAYTGSVVALPTIDEEDVEKCGDVFVGGDAAAYTDANGKLYVEVAGGTVYNVDGKLVKLVEVTAAAGTVNFVTLAQFDAAAFAAAANELYFVSHDYDWDVKTVGSDYTVTRVFCEDCKAEFDFVVGDTTDAVKKFGAGNYGVAGVVGPANAQETIYVSLVPAGAAADAPEADGEKVESAETFDAGIAMYVGMSVMAAAGSAVVLKKKD